MTTSAVITIVVPVYNYAHYLAECLGSVIAQTRPDWEVVVVDDGSTEGDPSAIVRGFEDGRITCVRHEVNRGLAAARNTGIRQGCGEYVLPLDADDKLAPTYLAEVLGAVGTDAEFNAVFTDFVEFGARHDRLSYRLHEVKALLIEQWIPGPGTVFRRSLWDAIGGYCEADIIRLGNEDWDFWLSAVTHGLRITHVPRPLYLYRQHGDSMVHRQQYYEHVTREFVYLRHRALFDRYGLKEVFLSRGYLSSAKTHWRQSEKRRALRLALSSFILAPVDCLQRVAEQTSRWLHRHRLARRTREAT